MGYVTQDTLEKTWSCYREIEAAEKLLNYISQMKERSRDPLEQRLRDAFGRGRHLQLGIPSGENGHRLFDVSPTIAVVAIINSHVANKRAELDQMHEIIKLELGQDKG